MARRKTFLSIVCFREASWRDWRMRLRHSFQDDPNSILVGLKWPSVSLIPQNLSCPRKFYLAPHPLALLALHGGLLDVGPSLETYSENPAACKCCLRASIRADSTTPPPRCKGKGIGFIVLYHVSTFHTTLQFTSLPP